jgi:8-oxo-dGTP pyrophosphatase MutT (NUDIX family)
VGVATIVGLGHNPRMSPPPVPAQPSATVVLLRDAPDGEGLEVLLARRQTRLAFHGGAWVFPGGRIDPADYAVAAPDATAAPDAAAAPDAPALEAAARRAALREAHEEVGLAVAGPLVCFAHWTTPDEAPKRFATWFLAAHTGGLLELPPPTYVTLCLLAGHAGADAALGALAAHPPRRYRPRPQRVPGGTVSVYEEDAAYADGALDRPGRRHRLWMLERGWRYERPD